MAIKACKPPTPNIYFEIHEQAETIHKGHLYERAENTRMLAQLGCGQEYDVEYKELTEGDMTFLLSMFMRSHRPFINKDGLQCGLLEDGGYIITRQKGK